MGYQLVRIMNRRQLPQPEKTVWKSLGDHASDYTGRGAFPSQFTIAQETGYSERHVQRILRKLEARGATVEVKKPGRRTSREYRIVINPPGVVVIDESRPDILSELNEPPPAGVKTRHPVTKTGHPDTIKTGHLVQLRPDMMST
jgi:DNA-binding MarR family transcriptional regulator